MILARVVMDGSLSQERKGLHEQNVFVVIIIVKKKHQKRLRIALLTEEKIKNKKFCVSDFQVILLSEIGD